MSQRSDVNDSMLHGKKITVDERGSSQEPHHPRVPQVHSAVAFPFGSGLCSWSSSAGITRLHDIVLGTGVVMLILPEISNMFYKITN